MEQFLEVTPVAIAGRTVRCLLWGCTVGGASDLLHPLGWRHSRLADGVWCLWIGWCWLVVHFSVCRGDIRLGYWCALWAGAVAWRHLISPILRPKWLSLWQRLERIVLKPFVCIKNFTKYRNFFQKNPFQRGKNRLQ